MFEFTRNFYSPTEISDSEITPVEGGSESSFTPGQVIIPEQTVETTPGVEGADPSARLDSEYKTAPDKLLINFDGTDYEVKVVKDGGIYVYDYPLGELDDRLFRITLFPPEGWVIVTPSLGTYTISAKIPEEKSKILSFPKGRTIVSELSRLNKAFGTISKKKTIIGQLSDIADAAEAGKIGGGSGLFIVNTKMNMVPGKPPVFENASKNASEIVNAASNNQLPVLFIHFEPNANDVAMPALYSRPAYDEGLLKYAEFNAIGANRIYLVDVDNKITLGSSENQ